ncbi:MAG: zinc-binding dehydrogenase [Spirochaetaceae bacterium]|jgi:NADPH:quinone reductase-like Zn-dependent oxidoreductase|nr:zinc-binding dehydrogenase [Spirochaetaceae bacterium]
MKDSANKIPQMWAMVTLGQGGYDQLQPQRMNIPKPNTNELLIKVLAAGMNNTEINTRLGWYSDSIKDGTNQLQEETQQESQREDGGWGNATPFPFIQGTDCCGMVIQSGSKKYDQLLNQRVILRPCMISQTQEGYTPWLGSDCNGAFAQYVKVPATEVFPIQTDWSDAELASIPCAYGTAENLLILSGLQKGQRIVITGASGGVGSAAVQLAKLRGCQVYGVCSSPKAQALEDLGAVAVSRERPILEQLDKESVDVVLDMVGGDAFPQLLDVLKRRGRYVSSGAIGGPIVQLDLRKLYLKDIQLLGATAWHEDVFPNLISYIEGGKIKPLVWKTLAMEDMVEAQREFLKKNHIGKMVLIPPDL